MLAALPRAKVWLPAPTSGSLPQSLTPTQGDLVPSSDLLEYCTHET